MCDAEEEEEVKRTEERKTAGHDSREVGQTAATNESTEEVELRVGDWRAGTQSAALLSLPSSLPSALPLLIPSPVSSTSPPHLLLHPHFALIPLHLIFPSPHSTLFSYISPSSHLRHAHRQPCKPLSHSSSVNVLASTSADSFPTSSPCVPCSVRFC